MLDSLWGCLGAAGRGRPDSHRTIAPKIKRPAVSRGRPLLLYSLVPSAGFEPAVGIVISISYVSLDKLLIIFDVYRPRLFSF